MNALNWIMENYQAIVGGVIATLGGLALICKLTPTPKDDAVIAKMLKWLNMVPKPKAK